MRLFRSALWTLLFVFGFSATQLGAQGLSDQDRKEAQKDLAAIFLNKQLVAKVTFPATKDGIDLKTDGTFDMKMVTRKIKDHGIGIEIDDKASVTDVKLKEKSIEIHLNGGGAGTFGDALLMSSKKKADREGAGGKVPGGSRINLKFDREITHDDLKDLDRLIGYFDTVVDTASLQQAVKRQAIPEEFKDAAAKKLVLMGMDKATVFAIMGEPKNKAVDLNANPPTEKWQFDLPSLKTRIVTFQGGKAIKIDEI